jgi:cobalt-zinc-cadmium efflux system outer membrane protein
VAGRKLGRALLVGAAFAALIGAVPARAAEAVPGATVDELLVLARRLSPELAARALESDAALAKAAAAGLLDDPMARITSDEVDRTSGSRINKMIYGFEQEFPLWGKRELRTQVARAEAAGARGRERGAAAELDARVKTGFATYWRASQAITVTHDLHALLHAVSRAAQTRYAQGLGTQSDAIRADVERSRLDLEFAALERERRAARGRLNALLARPAGAPFAEPRALRPMPDGSALRIEALLDRARSDSPAVATAAAEIEAAEGGRRLVDKSWYPDVTLGAAAIQRADGPPGYMASAGFRIPLQWGLREAQGREAAAKAAAARSRREAALLDIQGALEEALAGLAATRQTETLLTTGLKPQTEAAYRSALASYQLGRGDLTAVLEAAHRVQEVRLELLRSQAEERTLLAEIERAIGGDL